MSASFYAKPEKAREISEQERTPFPNIFCGINSFSSRMPADQLALAYTNMPQRPLKTSKKA